MLRVASFGVAFLVFASAPCRADWTIAAFAGGVHTRPADLRVTDLTGNLEVTFPDTRFRSESLDSPIYYGYRVGRSVYRDRVFIEAEMIHAKVFATFGNAASGVGRLAGQRVTGVPAASVVQRFAMSHGLNFILVNAAWRQPIRRRLAAVARAGIGPVLPHAETEIAGARREDYQWAGAGLQAAGGIELGLWRGLQATLEYKFTRARPRIDMAAGHADVTTHAHHVAVGASWMFRRR